jgi:hypothetical protein
MDFTNDSLTIGQLASSCSERATSGECPILEALELEQ